MRAGRGDDAAGPGNVASSLTGGGSGGVGVVGVQCGAVCIQTVHCQCRWIEVANDKDDDNEGNVDG